MANWTNEETNSRIEELNLRPKKCLNWKTPCEVHYGVRLLLWLANSPSKKISDFAYQYLISFKVCKFYIIANLYFTSLFIIKSHFDGFPTISNCCKRIIPQIHFCIIIHRPNNHSFKLITSIPSSVIYFLKLSFTIITFLKLSFILSKDLFS